MIDANLLKILCCPETHQPVALAEAALVESLNHRIARGELRTRAGEVLTQPLEGGLVRRDGNVLYPVRGEIPVMLIDESIPLAS
jgi:uncharacterized protein